MSLEVDLTVEIPWRVVLVWFTLFIQASGLSSVAWQHWLTDPMLLSKLYSDFVEPIKVPIIPVMLENYFSMATEVYTYWNVVFLPWRSL